MDPLSLTASIITVVGAGSAVNKGLKKILLARNLPDIVLQLNNEVTDIKYVVHDVDNLLRQHAQINLDDRRPSQSQASLAWALERAKQTLLALESLIAYELTTVDSHDGRTKIDWISWLRVESKVKSLKDDVRTDRLRLSAALSLLASHISLGLRDQMRTICFTVESLKVQVAQTGEAFMERQGGQTRVLRDSQQVTSAQPFQNNYGPSQASQTNAGMRPFQTSLGLASLGQPQSWRLDAMVRPYALNFGLARSFCGQGCTCACHQRGRIKSPSSLDALIGSLLVVYSTKPWVTRTCDSADCRGRSTSITYTYAFPQWFLKRKVTLKMVYDQSRGPELCLRVTRVRSGQDRIFLATSTNTDEVAIHHIQLLLSSGEASVLDVDPRSRSALQRAIFDGRYETAAFLITAGSDIFCEDFRGLCPYACMWQIFLSQSFASKSREFNNLFTLLNDPSHLTLFRLTPLIEAYLTSSLNVFRNVLSMTSRSTVDDVDVHGNTVLSWAVQRGDCDSVKRLLLCGSDPGHADFYGATPLHYAVCLDDVACMQLLLAAKADVNSKDIDGATALFRAVQVQDDTTFMELLLSHGATLEDPDRRGWVPLHYAVRYNNATNLQYLLQKGAKLNAVSKTGMTALELGVSFNAHDCLKLLLCNEAFECENSQKTSLLYWAVMYGDLETLRLLQASPRIKKITLDDDGAMRVAKWRRDDNKAWSDWAVRPLDKDPLEWYSAFDALWDDVVEVPRLVLGGDLEIPNGFVEGEQTDDDREEGGEDDNDDGNDDDDGDDGGQEPDVWQDAQESLTQSSA